LNYVRASPHNLVVKYDMGDLKKVFPVTLRLVSDTDIQIRHNAMESARRSANRHLETKLGKNGYRFTFRIFPHHILRENPLATGAGADRMSTGMKMSFGKPIGLAAQVKKGKTLIHLGVEESGIPIAKAALKRAAGKFPCKSRIVMD